MPREHDQVEIEVAATRVSINLTLAVIMEPLISGNLPGIRVLLQQYGVESAYLFGSAAQGTMQEGSDVDILIRFPQNMHYVEYADNYFSLAEALEALLHNKVDLVTEKTLKNPYLIRQINQHKLQLL